MVRRVVPVAAATCAALFLAVAAQAHDFWLIPDAFAVAEGSAIQVRGQTSSRFPTSESAVAIDRVDDARLLAAASEERITDMSHAGTSLVLRHRPNSRGQRIVALTLRPRSVRESAASFRRYLELEGAPEALDRLDREGLLRGRDSVTRRYAKYAKTLVEVGRGGPRAFSRRAGHPLELIPLTDPSALRAGDTLSLRILYRGQPLPAARAHAGYVASFSAATVDTLAARAADIHVAANADGVIRVAVASAGLWNVRMIHVAQAATGSGADWDTHWATLVFHVGPVASRTVQPAAAALDSSAVAMVVEQFHRALETGDSASALSLLAADAIILESGGVETRQEYRSHHLAGDIEFARAVRAERGPVRVTVQGDAAWATSTSTTVGSFRDRAINSANAELMVLTRTAGSWRIRTIHWSSRSRRPAPAPE